MASDNYFNRMMKRLIVFTILMAIASIHSVVFAQEYSPDQIDEMAERAAMTVRKAYKVLWDFRLEFGMADTIRDPGRTGVIGYQFSEVTTTIGYEDAKELSTEPGWAGWLVRELAGHGIWKRADVAVCMSGSFPALNIAVFAALQELGVHAKAISSVGASSYGANEPGFSWPEMERLLYEEGVLKIRSSAVTLGGTGDRGAELGDYGMEIAMKSVKRSLLPFIKPTSLRDAIKKRMRFYGLPRDYFCYINVGGTQASIGGGATMRFDRGGWYLNHLALKGDPPGVMDRFLQDGVPCLNLLFLERLDRTERITDKWRK